MSFFHENKKYILASLAIVLFIGGFLGGYFFSNAGYAVELSPIKFVQKNRENAPIDVNWQILWDALDVINKKYVDRPVDQLGLLYGAVSGLVDSLDDPYSNFLTPAKSQQFQEDLRGEFSGIGAEIGIRSGVLSIIAPLEGSPAQAAGLKAVDKILKVNGESTEDMSLDEAVSKIRGPKGSQVVLTILSEGAEEPREVAIIRDTIVVKSVTYEIKELSEVGRKRVGVIKLRRFGEDTKGNLDAIVTRLLSANVDGVVLDMRNNPGGYITSAIEVASNWVPEGKTVVSEQFGDGRVVPHTAAGLPRFAGLPTVVLVNEGSASASEIVAGALRDWGIAKLIGKKTFGKGSVQELVHLPEGADIKITIAKWLTPNGDNINIEGISPDVEVELTEEDVNAFLDPQMEEALEHLRSIIP